MQFNSDNTLKIINPLENIYNIHYNDKPILIQVLDKDNQTIPYNPDVDLEYINFTVNDEANNADITSKRIKIRNIYYNGIIYISPEYIKSQSDKFKINIKQIEYDTNFDLKFSKNIIKSV